MYGLDLVIFVLGLLSQLVAPIPHNEDDDADEDGWKKFVVTDRAGSKPLGAIHKGRPQNFGVFGPPPPPLSAFLLDL